MSVRPSVTIRCSTETLQRYRPGTLSRFLTPNILAKFAHGVTRTGEGGVVAWLPIEVYFLFTNVNPNLPFLVGLYYAAELIACLYTCANPFIYAVKFDPVKQVLVGMIPCKKAAAQAVGSDATPATGTGPGTGTRPHHTVHWHN